VEKKKTFSGMWTEVCVCVCLCLRETGWDSFHTRFVYCIRFEKQNLG
jgi:hypothetical protein